MTVTLYAFPPLPNPQKALLALQEFGIPYEVKTVNVIAAENLTPDFLSLNPNGTVPVLVIDLAGGQRKIISESSDIVLNAAARGHVQQTCDAAFVKKWVSDLNLWNGPLYTLAHDAVLKRMISSVNAYKVQLAEARQTQYPALEDAYIKAASRYRNAGVAVQDAAATADTQKQLAALLDAAEGQLSKTSFLAGDTYSAADVMLTCTVFLVEQAKQAKVELASRPKLNAWWKGIKQRASYKEVFGPATSPVTLLTLVLPAISKVMVKKALRQY
ncbi:hypothetical protein WJX79_008801 [Trebouxia sp. C0005]